MKAMLIKDLKLMKNFKQFFLIIVLIAVACAAVYNSPSFVLAYVTVVFSSMAVSTISYDNYENGGAFFFTLPVSRKGYVKEKYVLGMLLIVVSLSFASFLTILTAIIKKTPLTMEFPATILATILFAVLAISYMMPIHLKYRADKSKLVIMIGIGVFIFLAYFVTKFLAIWIDMEAWAEEIIQKKLGWVLCFVFVIAAVMLAISYRISVRIMERKEF